MKNRKKINDLQCKEIKGGEAFEVGSEVIWFFADVLRNLSFTPVTNNDIGNTVKYR